MKKFIPHEYQRYAAEYIITHPVTALLLDIGLGKTVTTLTAVNELMYDYFEISKVLVIAPLPTSTSSTEKMCSGLLRKAA